MVQRKICKSRQELSNEYLLAKVGFDTAENEPSKVGPIEHWGLQLLPEELRAVLERSELPRELLRVGVEAFVERFDIEPSSDFSAKWSKFMRLVLCCIDAKFCKKIFVGKLLTGSTRFTCFCTRPQYFRKKRQTFSHFSGIFCKFYPFSKKIIEICSEFDQILSEFRRYFRNCWKTWIFLIV